MVHNECILYTGISKNSKLQVKSFGVKNVLPLWFLNRISENSVKITSGVVELERVWSHTNSLKIQYRHTLVTGSLTFIYQQEK